MIIDATVGLGGHGMVLIDANPGLSLIGFDRDADALADQPRDALVAAHRHHGHGLDAAGQHEIAGAAGHFQIGGPQRRPAGSAREAGSGGGGGRGLLARSVRRRRA